MAPINLKEWKPVLMEADHKIEADKGNCAAVVSGSHQRHAYPTDSMKEIFGSKGAKAVVSIRNDYITKVAVFSGAPRHEEVFATRTSVQHRARMGHSAWWIRTQNSTVSECYCIVGPAFYDDYPQLNVTIEEKRLCERGRPDHIVRIRDLQTQLAEERAAVASLTEERDEANAMIKRLRKKYGKKPDTSVAGPSTAAPKDDAEELIISPMAAAAQSDGGRKRAISGKGASSSSSDDQLPRKRSKLAVAHRPLAARRAVSTPNSSVPQAITHRTFLPSARFSHSRTPLIRNPSPRASSAPRGS